MAFLFMCSYMYLFFYNGRGLPLLDAAAFNEGTQGLISEQSPVL